MSRSPSNLLRIRSAALRARSLLAYQIRYVSSFAVRQLASRIARNGYMGFCRGCYA